MAGGVVVFALDAIASRLTLVEKSEVCERVWLVIHSDIGPYLLGVWYRPPDPGEVASIRACEEEWQRLSLHVLGTILVGDLNVHHRSWLRHSARNSAEGAELWRITSACALRQIVRSPTRGEYLLDLATSCYEEFSRVIGHAT